MVNELQQTFVSGFHAALILCAAFAAIGIFTALVRGNESKRKSTIQPGATGAAALSSRASGQAGATGNSLQFCVKLRL